MWAWPGGLVHASGARGPGLDSQHPGLPVFGGWGDVGPRGGWLVVLVVSRVVRQMHATNACHEPGGTSRGTEAGAVQVLLRGSCDMWLLGLVA